MAVKPFYVRVERDNRKTIGAGPPGKDDGMDITITQRLRGSIITAARIMQRSLWVGNPSIPILRTNIKVRRQSNGETDNLVNVCVIDNDGKRHYFADVEVVITDIETGY